MGPLQTIIPDASNLYTELLIERVKEKFKQHYLGFWMLGGCSGGGMGFMFKNKTKSIVDELYQILLGTKRELEEALPFAMYSVLYDFSLNSQGTYVELVQIDAFNGGVNDDDNDDNLLSLITGLHCRTQQRESSSSSFYRSSSSSSCSQQQQPT
mmetsp:Transcript_1978/g.2268  ORF Transcript_1978/g.2268 Transcript_1978/m.2268 type:complete len:154 (+) Transcript_1978:332-793(+)